MALSKVIDQLKARFMGKNCCIKHLHARFHFCPNMSVYEGTSGEDNSWRVHQRRDGQRVRPCRRLGFLSLPRSNNKDISAAEELVYFGADTKLSFRPDLPFTSGSTLNPPCCELDDNLWPQFQREALALKSYTGGTKLKYIHHRVLNLPEDVSK